MMASHTTLDEKFGELQKAKETPQYYSPPKIQSVPRHLRNREKFKKHYSPKLVSIGPIHHDNVNLKLGEQYKLMWAAKYIEKSELNPQDLHKKIVDNIVQLKGLFAKDVFTRTEKSLKGFSSFDEKLSWMLFVDGCSLLHILVENENVEIKYDQLVVVMMDVLLLENQIPYLVLKLLWEENDNEIALIDIMKNFLTYTHWATGENETKSSIRSHIQACFEVVNNISKKKEEKQQHSVSIQNESESMSVSDPAHLLDLQRTIILTKSSSKGKKSSVKYNEMVTYRSIRDLKAIGIKLKSSATRRPTDIDFSEGWIAAKLTLPEIVVDHTTAATFLNLIAYEMCPDFKNCYEICSFAVFMDSLIDHAEDVKELRSKRILLNCLGSDEEVANLFNIISTDLVFNPLTYLEVRAKIDKHYCNKYKSWIALAIRTYFNNPWTFIAFLAAFIALALTFVQTLFTIRPTHK